MSQLSPLRHACDSSASEIGAMTGTDISLAAILLPAVLNYNDGISMRSLSHGKKKTYTIITFDPRCYPPTHKSGILILPSLRLRNWLINQQSRSIPYRECGRTWCNAILGGRRTTTRRREFTTTTNFHSAFSRESIAVSRLNNNLSKFTRAEQGKYKSTNIM